MAQATITPRAFEKLRVTDKATGHQINVTRFVLDADPDRYAELSVDEHPTHDLSGMPVAPKVNVPKAAKAAAKTDAKAATADAKN